MSTQQPAATPLSRIVVGVDGTPSSIAALRWAVGLAGRIDAHVVALMGWRPDVAYGYPDVHYVREAEEKRFEEAVDAVGGEVAVERVFAQGSADGLLISASAEADLLVLGARRHTGLVGLVLGSVSARVMTHAHCPVVVVPAEPVTEEAAQAEHVTQPVAEHVVEQAQAPGVVEPSGA